MYQKCYQAASGKYADIISSDYVKIFVGPDEYIVYQYKIKRTG